MEPIVIDRKTGKVISAPTLTQEQRDKLWGQYVRNYVRRHPEVLLAIGHDVPSNGEITAGKQPPKRE